MSRHVAPQTWADAFAGRLSDDERAAIEQHAEGCEKCARSRARVGRASDSFASLRAQTAPELPWDAVRARVHWTVSKERRARTAPVPRRSRFAWPRRTWLALGLAAVGGIGVVIATQRTTSSPAKEPTIALARVAPAEAPSPPPAPAPAPLAGLVNRAAGEVRLDGVRPAELFTQRLVVGNVIATGDGAVDVQFGEASAFALGPGSTLELRRFDAEAIELAVTGTIDVEVAARRPGQRFLVIAGEHTVEVRGTQFRVEHVAEGTRVACRHGRVAVRDRAAEVEVGTARGLRIAPGTALTEERVAPLTVDELDALARATPLQLPLWDVDALARNSAPLSIATPTAATREVRVDGVELGRAPLAVRVMPGRHTVEAADHAGRFRRAGWVDVAGAGAGARLALPAERPPTAGIAARRRELRAGLDHARLASCTRSIAKAGLSGTYVQIELAVDEHGAVGFLNVIDTDLPSSTARCVRESLAQVRFRAGAAATLRERIDL